MNVELNSNYDLDRNVIYNSKDKISEFYKNAAENNTRLKIYDKSVDISNYELKSIKSTSMPNCFKYFAAIRASAVK